MIFTQNHAIEDIGRFADLIFIYPTDTIYGIGCDATDTEKVKKIQELKQRDDKPFSIIAPSKEWILERFSTTREELDRYLPGPYTLLLKKKEAGDLTHISANDYVGIRIPDHRFTRALQGLGVPVVTTSVNISGKPPATAVQDIDESMRKQVDAIVDAGTLSGRSSILVCEGRIMKR